MRGRTTKAVDARGSRIRCSEAIRVLVSIEVGGVVIGVSIEEEVLLLLFVCHC
jgi:hypothetical protein